MFEIFVEILLEYFCSMLKLMIEEWRWISRDEHVPRFSGIDRETESECARFDCMFTNVDYALIENEDADTTRARPPPLSVPFLFFQSFHRPPDENQNKRALPPPKAAKHSLKYILKYILFREPGNRNLTFIPRGNNTTPFEKNVRTTRFLFSQILLFPLEKNLP